MCSRWIAAAVEVLWKRQKRKNAAKIKELNWKVFHWRGVLRKTKIKLISIYIFFEYIFWKNGVKLIFLPTVLAGSECFIRGLRQHSLTQSDRERSWSRECISEVNISKTMNMIGQMDSKVCDSDLDEYLTEYKLQTPTEPISHYDGE